ncbi:MAG: DUF3147 family protein [Actinomycetota bacterium]|nr:DUF3147 family protein [Actinomycetota bacterium]
MSDIGVIALRGLAGGTLVVVFALIGEVVSPKAFSGLFAAAPSVAVASLAITIAFEGAARARQDSIGMVVGAIAMTVCCILAAVAIPRLRALAGSALAWAGWFAVGLGLYWAVFVGAR